jgi:hypothetical protein
LEEQALTHSFATNELGIGWRDGLAQFAKRHPVDAEGFGSGSLVATFPNVLCAAPAVSSRPLASMAPVDANNWPIVVAASRLADEEIAFEKAVALSAATLRSKAEHRAAKRDRIAHGRLGFLDVLDDPRNTGWHPVANLIDQERRTLGAWGMTQSGVTLARRARPYEIEAVERERERVGLNEGERISRLRLDIDADDFEPCTVQAHARTASAAKQIECSQFAHAVTRSMMMSFLLKRPMKAIGPLTLWKLLTLQFCDLP